MPPGLSGARSAVQLRFVAVMASRRATRGVSAGFGRGCMRAPVAGAVRQAIAERLERR